jgi:RNA polymerase sigma-70 factor (ECF subfamily)
MPVTHEQAATAQDPVPEHPGDEEERAVVRRAQAGDREAFDRLYEKYHTPIWNFCYRMMGNPHDGEELTADAFLKAWLALTDPRSRAGSDPGLRFGAWMYRVAQNVCLDELRHRKLIAWTPWETFMSIWHPSQVAKDSPERDALRREDAEEVEAILENVLPRYRSALLLREYHGLSYGEIAEVLGATRATVKSLLYRAREDFRHFYGRATRKPGRATERGCAPAPPVALTTGRNHRITAEDRQRISAERREEGARLGARREALGLSSHAVCREARIGGATLSDLEKRGQAGDESFRRVRAALDALEASRAAF